ncbi:MAG: type II toxin-antitoxin system PemK/MazF family toxin [Deltaproteobacteria bacterium]|nr:type II toxin-antitoxin system PemK/MazF family toxin [Deltaproteobacteria bacterium]MBN2671117.1 type II toxin-antitoxin system PemK/MazF family toxin [Deltaproteobacteria bacterium]
MKIERYSIYWANLDPVVGAEINKTRPVAVVSDDLMNLHLQTVVVCPLTTAIHSSWRSRIQISVKSKESEIAVDQIRTISKKRLIKKIGALSADEAARVRLLITEMYGEKSP